MRQIIQEIMEEDLTGLSKGMARWLAASAFVTADKNLSLISFCITDIISVWDIKFGLWIRARVKPLQIARPSDTSKYRYPAPRYRNIISSV